MSNNDWFNSFSKNLTNRLQSAGIIASALVVERFEKFVDRVSHLNSVCEKVGIVITCVGIIGIVWAKSLVGLVFQPTLLSLVSVLAIFFAVFAFGAGLLVAAILQQSILRSPNLLEGLPDYLDFERAGGRPKDR